MTLFALWLGMVGVADLLRWRSDAGLRRQLVATGAAGAGGFLALVLGGLPAGQVAGWGLGLTALTGLWLGSSWTALHRRRLPALPFGVLAGSALGLLAGSGRTPRLEGVLTRWYDSLTVPATDSTSFDRFAVLLGGLLFLQATANVVVRLVLDGAGSPAEDSESTLKGGRVLGPMERTFIFALGAAGQLTAAAIVVAAKGLLRFPELQRGAPARVDALTEYFLVGSLTSWLLALALLPLT